MSRDHNRELLRTFIERVYGQGEIEAARELFVESPSFPLPNGERIETLDELESYLQAGLGNFEDVDVEIHTVLADETEAIARWTVTARLVGDYAGIAPAGREVSVGILTVGQVRDGKLETIHDRYDRRKFLPPVSRLARSGIIENMRDGILVLDDDDRVADVNPAALDILGLDRERAIDRPASSLFDDEFEVPEPGETGELLVDDGRRIFEVDASVVTDTTGDPMGRTLLLHEVSERERRTRQLQVLNRVLRHNLRNALTTISGRAEYIATDDGDDPSPTDDGDDPSPTDDGDDPSPTDESVREAASTIVAKSQELSALSRKVTKVGETLSPEDEPRSRLDAVAVLASAVERVERAHPDATIQTTAPPEAPVVAATTLQFALEALVENAVEHGSTSPESNAPRDAVEHGSTSPEANAPRDAVEHGSTAAQPVTITVEYVDRDDEDRVRIEIADEGPGIPDHVLRALEAERETPLEHTTGLGLWLAQWVVTLSGGTLAFDTDDSRGTVVAVELPTPESNPDG